MGELEASGAFGCGRAVVAGFTEVEMPQDLFDNGVVFYEADGSHFPAAFRANQRIDLIDFLDQPRPASSKRPGRYIRFHQRRYIVVRADFFSQTA